MTKTYALLLFLLPAIAYSQSQYNWQEYAHFRPTDRESFRFIKRDGVKSVAFTYANKKGPSAQLKKTYDKSGNITNRMEIDKKGVVTKAYTYRYNEDNKLLEMRNKKKEKLTQHIVIERNANGLPVQQTNLDKKGKITKKHTWKYNQENKVIESERYKKNRLQNKWVYQYLDHTIHQRTILYNKKGEVQYTWSFDCKEEGEKLEKKEKESQVCRWSESQDEYLIKVYQNFDSKGKIVKYVSKYTLADTLLLEHSLYNENEQLTQHTTYDKSHERILSYENFRKGKTASKTVYTYENNLLVAQVDSWKGKVTRSFKYTYEGGMLKQYDIYDKKDKLLRSTEVNYEFW